MNKLSLECFIIDEAANFISLLSKPISSYLNFKENNLNLYGKWIQYFIELYNNRTNFLLMSKTNIFNTQNRMNVLDSNFNQNYENMQDGFKKLQNSNILTGDLEITINSRKSFIDNNFKLDKFINIENKHKKLLDKTIFTMIFCIFQYLQEFEEDSINTNLWNYCLKSFKFSQKWFITGLLILICQYTWICALAYNIKVNFYINYEPLIILIAITTTCVSLFYSYNSMNSFIKSQKLYKFLLKLYDDYPSLVLTKEEQNFIYFQDRYITMKRIHIYYNWFADFLSNFILPIIIPIINIFVILSSETVVDAILNCMAIFFIIHIDEELYSVSTYKNEKLSINFTKWLISNVYCKYFSEFTDIFRNECDNWQRNFKQITKTYKSRKIAPEEIFFEVSSIN